MKNFLQWCKAFACVVGVAAAVMGAYWLADRWPNVVRDLGIVAVVFIVTWITKVILFE